MKIVLVTLRATILVTVVVAIFGLLIWAWPAPSEPTCFGNPMTQSAVCTEPSNSTPSTPSPRSYQQRLDEQLLTHFILLGIIGLALSGAAIVGLVFASPVKVSHFFGWASLPKKQQS